MRDLIKAMKALSDETRLRILNLLLERECCVCEVMQALDISQTRASRNLSALYDAGFLTLHKEGLWSLYAINTYTIEDYRPTLLEAIRKAFKGNRLLDDDGKRLKKSKRVGPGCAVPRKG